jgi:kumamolisin
VSRLFAAVAAVAAVVGARADTTPGKPSAVQPVTLVGPTSARSTIDFSLVLKLDRPRLARYLAALEDPSSPQYHRYLTAGEFGTRFGLGDDELATVRDAALAGGLQVLGTVPQRTSLRVRGTVAQASRFLRTGFVDYLDANGVRFHAPTAQPRLPPALGRAVAGAAGLDTRPLPLKADIPGGRLGPEETEAAYHIKPLHDAGFHGEGMTIAILSFDSFNPSDVALYDKTFGITGPPVERVLVNGGAEIGSGEDEVNLDIDTVRSIAPKAQILNYEAPNQISNFSAIFDKIVADGRVDIVSVSWGICATFLEQAPAERQAIEQSMAAAVARGISIFVASGDAGAYECQRADPEDHRLTVSFPSDSQYAVSVGGTLLATRKDGTYLEETGWEDPLSNGGGGGGLSPVAGRPDWQKAPGVDNRDSNGKRQTPDVSAAADPDSGFAVAVRGEVTSVGGTSAATPFWAGSMLLIHQYAKKQGLAKLGFVAPALYRLATKLSGAKSPYHDVTRGGNRHYNAGPGWDYSTGLGSPDVWALAQALVTELK